MKKVMLHFPGDRQYLIGYATSLKSFLLLHQSQSVEGLHEMAEDAVIFRAYHKTQRQEVTWELLPIYENSTCFMKSISS